MTIELSVRRTLALTETCSPTFFAFWGGEPLPERFFRELCQRKWPCRKTDEGSCQMPWFFFLTSNHTIWDGMRRGGKEVDVILNEVGKILSYGYLWRLWIWKCKCLKWSVLCIQCLKKPHNLWSYCYSLLLDICPGDIEAYIINPNITQGYIGSVCHSLSTEYILLNSE